MKLSRKFAQVFVLTIAVGLSVVLVVGIWRGKTQNEKQGAVVSDPSESEMKLTDMEFTEIQDGRRFWTLTATEAKYFQDQQKTFLKKVHLTFFMDDGGEILLESDKGVLYAGTKNIELQDSVRATLPYGYTLTSDRAFYNHTEKVIYSDTPLFLAGPDLRLDGKQWRCRIIDRRAYLDGGVTGVLTSIPAAMNRANNQSQSARPQ